MAGEQAGNFRHFGTFYRESSSRFGTRGQRLQPGKEKIADRWLKIEPMRGEEDKLVRINQAIMTHKVTTRWGQDLFPGTTDNLSPPDWLEVGDRRFDIGEIRNLNNERNQFIEMLVAEKV